jgi:small subunit ribosomal protein S6
LHPLGLSLYESVIIIRQETSAQQVEALGDTYADVISKNGGRIKKRENWGLRSLAYKIKKNRKGHYIILSIDCEKQLIEKIKDFFNLNEDIIRDLTTSVEKHDEEHSTLYQQSKSFRESRNWDTKNN